MLSSVAAQPISASAAARADAPVERVRLRLLHAVAAHRLPPGAKLTEEEVARVFGVSRTVVRAALQALAHDGVVAITRNRGAFVASPAPREAREVFEARALLEPRTARSAARLARPDDIARLKRHIADEHAALAEADLGRALRLSGLFHIEIARIADQATITGFIETLIARSSLIIALYRRRESALCESTAHHALVDAMATANAARAEDLMRNHLEDLHSALDLRERAAPARSLRQALLP